MIQFVSKELCSCYSNVPGQEIILHCFVCDDSPEQHVPPY